MSSRTLESSDHVETGPGGDEPRTVRSTRTQRFAAWMRGMSPAERWVLTGTVLAIAWFTGLILLATHLSVQSFLYH